MRAESHKNPREGFASIHLLFYCSSFRTVLSSPPSRACRLHTSFQKSPEDHSGHQFKARKVQVINNLTQINYSKKVNLDKRFIQSIALAIGEWMPTVSAV